MPEGLPAGERFPVPGGKEKWELGKGLKGLEAKRSGNGKEMNDLESFKK